MSIVDMPRVSVIIPAWNEAASLPECLESVFASTYRNIEAIVVDNGSTDGSSQMLARRFPKVRILRNEQNVGFGSALNRGSAEAEGDFLLWLNADAILDPRWVETMVQVFLKRPTLGMAASAVTYRDAPTLIWSAGGWIDGLTGFAWDHGKGEDISSVAPAPNPDYVAACAPLVRRVALEKAGGLDEEYFIYFEDADLGMRLKAAGYELAVLRDLPTRHGALRRTGLRGTAQRKLFLFARSNLRFTLKNWTLLRLPAALLWWLGFYTAFAIARGPRRYLPSVVRAAAWNLQHLEETKASKAKSLPLQLPQPRVGELYRFLTKMAQQPELFPY